MIHGIIETNNDDNNWLLNKIKHVIEITVSIIIFGTLTKYKNKNFIHMDVFVH